MKAITKRILRGAGIDNGSPVADAYFDKAPFEFEGTLKRLHFANLE